MGKVIEVSSLRVLRADVQDGRKINGEYLSQLCRKRILKRMWNVVG